MTDTETLRTDLEVVSFDLYDTLLDRESTLVPALETCFERTGADEDPGVFLRRYLAMHFRDSLIDSLIDGPHTPFEEITRRALVYRLEQAGIDATDEAVGDVVAAWRDLDPYPGVAEAMRRLGREYELVGLSNGDPEMLEAVRPTADVELDGVVSVAEAGAYKPHPAPYRLLLDRYGVEPHEVLFVTAHTFDLVGARAVGVRGCYLNRHGNPYGGWPRRPDVRVETATELADVLVGE